MTKRERVRNLLEILVNKPQWSELARWGHESLGTEQYGRWPTGMPAEHAAVALSELLVPEKK